MKNKPTLFAVTGSFMMLLMSVANAQWIQTKGPYCGSIGSLAVNSEGDLFAGTDVGVFVSTNNGTSWTTADPGFRVLSLASDGDSVFAGTDNGVYISCDKGASWTLGKDGLENSTISSLVLSKGNLFAGANNGVFLSTDKGKSWTAVDSGLPENPMMVNDVAVDDNGDVFAALSSKGVFRSIDNGKSWTAVNSGLTNTNVKSLLVRGNKIFAGTAGTGIFLSTDRGESWTLVNSGLPSTLWGIYSFAVNDVGNIFAASNACVFFSSNGTSWSATNLVLSVDCLAAKGNEIFAGTKDGVFLSNNNGTSWTKVNSGITGVNINSLMEYKGKILAGTDGNGVYLSDTNVTSGWTPADSGLTGAYVSGLGVINGRIFAGTDKGISMSTDNGISWKNMSPSSIRNVNTLLVNGSDLFAGTSEGIFLSSDNGSNWNEVDSGITKKDILCFAVKDNNLFAGTYGGGIFRSTDDGRSWTQVNSGLTNVYVWSIAVSGDNIFAGTHNGLFISANDGSNWTVVNCGLPVNTFIYTLVVNKNNIVAGASGYGVLISRNNGTDWTGIDSGLPANTSVLSLMVSSHGDLFAGTIRRGVWRGPLSDMVNVIKDKPLSLSRHITEFNLSFSSGIHHEISIGFTLPASGRVSFVAYNINGRKVACIADQKFESGQHNLIWNTSKIPAGCYTVKITSDKRSFVKSALIK